MLPACCLHPALFWDVPAELEGWTRWGGQQHPASSVPAGCLRRGKGAKKTLSSVCVGVFLVVCGGFVVLFGFLMFVFN